MLSIDSDCLRIGLSRARFVGMCYGFYLPTEKVREKKRKKKDINTLAAVILN